ncbi:MAG: prepilin peptidase [Armatimonadetes bacterium]|nr:prepilin peptidase [Armatimonadota bacterium]MCX7777894.1 prepilin peptidase [Armatimonadota bacterium]
MGAIPTGFISPLQIAGIVIAFVVGACFGSFANVCIYRLPRRMSILNPPSHCTFCGTTLRWHDLIPILSILMLLGKCRYCKHPIGYRHFFVELLCALSFVASFWRHGVTVHSLIVAMTLVGLIVAFFTDCEWYLIPDEVPLAIGALGVFGALVASLSRQFLSPSLINIVGNQATLLSAIMGMLVGALVLSLIRKFGTAIFRKEAMGLGDVKLTAAIGSHIGLSWALVGYFLIAIMIGAIVGIVILLMMRKRPHHYMPFGPFLSLAAVVCLLFPETITHIVQSIYGLQPVYL